MQSIFFSFRTKFIIVRKDATANPPSLEKNSSFIQRIQAVLTYI